MDAIAPTQIRLAFYESPTEPRIMMFGPMSVDLKSLEDCFKRLSRGEAQVEFHALPFVFAHGDIKLRMCSVGRVDGGDSRIASGLCRVENELDSFEWARTCEGWGYLAELLSGLTVSPKPAHQYVTRYPDEDAIVVVSKGEYDDSVMAR
ncbi:MAG: hypothetical protein AAFN77_07470 [Planctomycetota bacterium]